MIRFKRHTGESSWIRAIVSDFAEAAAGLPPDRPARICLAGGTTPEAAYAAICDQMLAIIASDASLARDIGSRRFMLFIGDERIDARGEDQRNETMVRRAFSRGLESGAVGLIGWKRDAGDALYAMDAEIGRYGADGEALFDLCYLGLGADGHTAGIFPGAAPPFSGRTAAGRSPVPPYERVGFTLDTLRSSRRTRFIVKARGKEKALARMAERDRTCPAYLAATADTVVFVLA